MNVDSATKIYSIASSLLTISWCYSVTIKPDGPVIYSASNQSLTITCTFTLPASDVACNSSRLVISRNNYSSSLLCPPDYPSSCGPSSHNLTTEWASSVSASISYPNHSTIECNIRFSTIQDDNYTCAGYVVDAAVETKPFVVLNTVLPDQMGISQVGRGPTVLATATEGENITLTCFANRSRPHFVLTWREINGTLDFPHVTSDAAGWFSSSLSVSFVATMELNGTRVTCSGTPQQVTNWPGIRVNTDVYLVVQYSSTLPKKSYGTEYNTQQGTKYGTEYQRTYQERGSQEISYGTEYNTQHGTEYGTEYQRSSQDRGSPETQSYNVVPANLQLQTTSARISRNAILSMIIGGTVAIAIVIILIVIRNRNSDEATVPLSAKESDADKGKRKKRP